MKDLLKGNVNSVYIRFFRPYGARSYDNVATATVTVEYTDKTKAMCDLDARMGIGLTDETVDYEYEGRTYTKYSGHYQPERGFWSLLGCTDRLADLLAVIPTTATLRFEVCLDALTTENHVAARMHGDALYMVATYNVRGKDVTRRFLLDTSTCLHNTARFGRGE